MAKITFNLETIPDQRDDALARAHKSITVPCNYKKPEAREKYKRDHLAEAHAKTAKAGISGQICSIGWAIDNDKPRSLTRGIDVAVEDERALIRAFFDAIHSLSIASAGAHMHLEWIGHSLIDDLRFLKQRSLILGVQPLFQVPADAVHGKGTVYDTMQEWAGDRGSVKQSALQKALGISTENDIRIDGAHEVRKFWEQGLFHEIKQYNMQDIRVCQSIYRRLKWGA